MLNNKTMKKRTIFGILIILILVTWGVLSHGFKENPLNSFYPFMIEEKVIKEDLKDGSISIKYPVTKYAILNEAIKVFINAEQNNFKENINGLATISSAKGNLEINYKSYISDRIISLQFNENIDTGGAHGNFVTITLNYDKNLDKVLKTSDLFKDQNQYLNDLSLLIKPRLKIELEKIQFQDNIWLEEGAGPKEDNYKQFVFTKDGLTFFFDPYQIAPYTAGAQDIILTYQELSSLLLPEYSQLKF